MKDKLWIVIIIFGMFVTIGSIIADLVLAFNGIFIPTGLAWSISMIGVCSIALGVVFAIGDTKAMY